MHWQSIETAPHDRVILTDEGTAKHVDPDQWVHPKPKAGWYLCALDGHTPSCAEMGMEISLVEPKRWMEIPALPSTP